MGKRYSDDELQQIEASFRELIEERNTVVFLIDPSTAGRKSVQNVLEKEGVENFVEAKKASEALRELKKTPANAIPILLVESKLPDMDIVKFLQSVKAIDSLKDPVILLTSQDINKQQLVLALKAGATGFLKKPLAPEAIVAKFKELKVI